jgi:adenylate cyclase
MIRRFPRKLLIGVISGAVASLFVWVLVNFGASGEFLYKFEAATYDYRLRKIVEPPRQPIEDVVIIDIDGRSLNKLGAFQQWPRTYWAKAVEILEKGNARMIALDVLFDRSNRFPEEDGQFIQAVKAYGRVFNSIALSLSDADNFLESMPSEPAGLEAERFRLSLPDDLLYNLPMLDRIEPEFTGLLNAGAGIGSVNLTPDNDGISRRVPLFMRFNDRVYPTLATAMALAELGAGKILYHSDRGEVEIETARNSPLKIPLDDKSKILIYYHGPFQTFRYIPFFSLISEQVPIEYFNNKVVIIGASAPGLSDLRSTPWQPSFPGVEVHANVFHQIMNRHFIRELSGEQQFLFIMALGILAGLLFTFLRPLGGGISGVVFYGLVFIAAWLAFAFQFLWIPLIAPFLTILLTYTVHYAYRYVVEERDKREIKKIFAHYVSPGVVEELLKKPEMIKLGGEKKVGTVLFSDLAGFTALAAVHPPEEVVKLLNAYLTEMSHIVLDNHGTLDKYEGDAIMAIFGAPVEIENHALAACKTAMQMQQSLEKMREDWKRRKLPELHQRIGINSGEMVIGNMGSDIRFDYTAIGDSVNLGARLESANKLYGTGILISDATFQIVKDQVVVRQLDLLRVRGKQEPVKVYELIAMKNDTLDVKTREMLSYFQQGYEHYLSRQWEYAGNQFRQALQIYSGDGPSRLYLERCDNFMNNPPSEDWDGAHDFSTK